jgi:hypothetical protein
MMQKRLCLSLLCLILAACAPSQGGDPADAVEAYFTALVNNERENIAQLVCPEYEGDAQIEFDSFGAVSGATLTDMNCTRGDADGEFTVVTCTGSIDYTYNGEADSQDLSLDNYLTKQVDGEWKMCGYQ